MRELLRVTALLCVLAGVAGAQESAWTLFEKGVKEFQQGRYDTAERILEAAARSDARCEDAFYYLGRIQERKGKTKEAAELYGRVSEKYPTFALAAERLGHIALRAGDNETAHKHFKAYADKKKTAMAYMQLASVELNLKKYEDAEATLKKATELSREDLDIVDMWGRLYMETERYGEALDAYSRIVKQIPVDTNARYLRGVCLRKLDRRGEAIEDWEKILERDPYHGLALRALIAEYEAEASKARLVEDYRLRLKRLAKAKPPTRPVKGGN